MFSARVTAMLDSKKRVEELGWLKGSSPSPTSIFHPNAYPKSCHFYSLQSSLVRKSKMAATVLLHCNSDIVQCHCLRKCFRGQKLWSTDLAETWHRSWVWWLRYFKSHFGSLLWLLVLELQGGSHLLPFEHQKSSLPGGHFASVIRPHW